ncbi:MAG: Acyltransferase family protein [Nocardioides sp.]|nr:Acyltransferase family protein [Nocardioides sp.]
MNGGSQVAPVVNPAERPVESDGTDTRPDFPVLDTLRAVGALAVLTTHSAFWAGEYTRHGVWGTVLSRLDVGVAIFFVLSGFLLSLPFLTRAAQRRSRPSTGRYLWKRFLRIGPVYLLAAVLALCFIDANATRGVRDWIVTLTLTNTFLDPLLPAGLSQMWSLAVEVTFYLLLPALMVLAVGRRGLQPWRVVSALAGLVAVSVWWHLGGADRVAEWTSGAPLQWLPGYLIWFAAGIALALLFLLERSGHWARVTAPVARLGRQPGVCWAIAGGLLLVAATQLAGPSLLAAPTHAESLTKNVLYAGIGGIIVLTGVFTSSHGGYTRFFAHPVARHLGWISYGVFCLHLPILHLVMWATGWTLFRGHFLGIWALTLVVSLVAAEIVYRLVERPAMRLKDVRRSSGSPTAEAKRPTSGTSTR